MPSLSTIDAKLSELIKTKTDTESKEPTQEEKDEERLRELDAKILDITDLLSKGVTRESVDSDIDTHRERVASSEDEKAPFLRVYHDHGGKRINTTRRTQSKMHLAEALKLRIRVGKHAKDLEHALHILVREQVEILERQVGRVGQKRPRDA